jgi:hypothetical protein
MLSRNSEGMVQEREERFVPGARALSARSGKSVSPIPEI